mgnify:CR=1 FL=1
MDKKQAYIQAIENEIRSQNLYQFMAVHCENKEKNIFVNLIPMEKMHEEKMRSFFYKEFPGETLNISADLLPKTQKKIDEMKDPKSIFDFAIEREKMAQEAYMDLALNCDDEDMKTFFKQMAEEEKNHADILFTEIEKLENTMIWFDESELNGLMEY